MNMKLIATAAFLLGLSVQAIAGPPKIYADDGKYLGDLSANQYAPNSTSNAYGEYGSQYSPDSINNAYGKYGSPYSPDSPNNAYSNGSSGSGSGLSLPGLDD
jgi:hypothetical protein